jgi:DNA-binding NarL/FixJ family response regulator
MTEVSTPIGCLVADDHPAVLECVCEVLTEHGISIVGRATTGPEAVEKIETRTPQVALLDVRMPRLSGLEITRRVARSAPDTAILLYTGLADRALVLEALDAGARGFVLKEAPLPDLVRAVETIASGATYIDPVLAGSIATTTDRTTPTVTQREREILRLLADGLSNEDIGKQLFISPETVRTHVRKAMAKLDADTRTHAVATALRQSLIA